MRDVLSFGLSLNVDVFQRSGRILSEACQSAGEFRRKTLNQFNDETLRLQCLSKDVALHQYNVMPKNTGNEMQISSTSAQQVSKK